MIPTIVGVSILTFALARLAPGDPIYAVLGSDYTEEQADQMRNELGLDRSIPEQYLIWVGDVARGDLGRSIVMNQDVTTIIEQRIPTTLYLAFLAVALALLISIPMGVLTAVYKDSWIDNLLRAISIVAASMPVFWTGILMVKLFSVRLGWFPAAGGLSDHGAKALVLPAVVLSSSFGALITRMVRSMMLEVIGDDYVRTARAKGLGQVPVLGTHALRNALIPVITVIGLQFGMILGGAVLTEAIFNIPGMGRLVMEAASRRDYPLIQGVVLVTAISFVLVNLLVDVIYAVADPRIRVG
jgi:ABC-type dipeptide/oligopeptide/nickel transport system permease component